MPTDVRGRERKLDGDPSEVPAAGLGALLAALGPLLIALAVSPAYPRLGAGASLLTSALQDPLPGLGPHPLAALAARACAQLPLGALALRVELSSALWLALAAAASYRALDLGLRALGLERGTLASPLALAAVWLAFGTPALAASRVQAAAAAIALCALALERMTCALQQPRLRARACMRWALLWLVLLWSEQPLLALALALGCAPALLLDLGERGALPAQLRALWPVLLLAPLPAIAWYAALTHDGSLPLTALELQAPGLAGLRALGDAPVARALLAAGAIGVLRVRSLRGPFGLFSGAAVALALATCVAVDAVEPGLAVLPLAAMLAAGAIAVSLIGRARGWLAHGVALGAVALGLSQMQVEGKRALGSDGAGNELLGDELRTSLPPRALGMPGRETLRAQRAAELEERARPDVALLPAPFGLDVRTASALERQHPELRSLLRAQLLAPAHLLPELTGLAVERPLLLELDPDFPPELRAALLPYGLWHVLATSEPSKADLRVAAASADARLERLHAQLDPPRALPELRATLARLLNDAAVQARSSGDPERADRLRARAVSWN